MKEISVITCAHNPREEFLRRLLEGFASANYRTTGARPDSNSRPASSISTVVPRQQRPGAGDACRTGTDDAMHIFPSGEARPWSGSKAAADCKHI
jgi:hypothetical protein